MEKVCGFCGAWYLEAEKNSVGKYTACCSNGAVKLPPICPPPQYIQELLLGNSPDGKCLKKKARAFNSKLSFASVSMNQYLFPNTRGVPALRISGSIYHNIGAIHPEPEQQAKFCSVFFMKVAVIQVWITLSFLAEKFPFAIEHLERLNNSVLF